MLFEKGEKVSMTYRLTNPGRWIVINNAEILSETLHLK